MFMDQLGIDQLGIESFRQQKVGYDDFRGNIFPRGFCREDRQKTKLLSSWSMNVLSSF